MRIQGDRHCWRGIALSTLVGVVALGQAGCSESEPTVSSLTSWAEQAEAVTAEAPDAPVQKAGQARLSLRYSANEGGRVESLAIRLDPDEESYSTLVYSYGSKDPFEFEWSEREKAYWHYWESEVQAHIGVFADTLERAGFGQILGDTQADSVIDFLRFRSDPTGDQYDRGRVLPQGPWRLSSVNNQAAVWDATVKGTKLRLTFCGLMRGTTVTPVELSVAWGDGSFPVTDPAYSDNLGLPYGVLGYPPFAPPEANEHLENGGVVWVRLASDEESWNRFRPGIMDCYLLSEDQSELVRRVFPSYSSPDLIKGGAKWWTDSRGPDWQLRIGDEVNVTEMDYVEWSVIGSTIVLTQRMTISIPLTDEGWWEKILVLTEQRLELNQDGSGRIEVVVTTTTKSPRFNDLGQITTEIKTKQRVSRTSGRLVRMEKPLRAPVSAREP